eukprot:CAMPEP_0119049296 /NCGR_PEP_ID=MMETSP1177-20130426/63947_1 /TAXON_ID=2985 /ORGANISM="Ochromonas sp, Strain CCMP1899" /LENGTH=483 /DNA_ID=CAMNT_0007026357 /DNA_START=323 /DNA_END=1775 /DNA_ORIENTATION=-
MSLLPIVPFVMLPRKKWEARQEKKSRVELIDDSPAPDEENINPESTSVKSALSDDSKKNLEQSEIQTGKYNFIKNNYELTTNGSQTHRSGKTGVSRSFKSGIGSSVQGTSDSGSLSPSKSPKSRSGAFAVQYSKGMLQDDLEDETPAQMVKKDLFNLFNELDDDPEIGFWEIVQEVGFLNYLKFWRSAARKRRMHYIIIEYEKQIAVYDQEVKDKLREEIESNERAVLKRVELMETRKQNNTFAEKMKRKVAVDMDYKLVKYEKEAAQQAYYCSHMSDWAIEKHDIKMEDKLNNENNLKLKNKIKIENSRKAKNSLKIEKEKKILKDDHDISQNILKIMRKGGDIEGVNVVDKGMILKSPMKSIDSEVLELHLNEGINFKNWKKNKNGIKNDKQNTKRQLEPMEEDVDDDNGQDDDHFAPFNVDLSIGSIKVTVLQCYLLGERGAMCLAAEFVRGACPFLEILDMSNCEIQQEVWVNYYMVSK